MLSKNIIISGIVSGVMLAASSFTTPVSAGQVSFNFEIGIKSLLNELIASDDSAPKVQNIDYRGVPIRKIHRNLSRRGLYPVSDYRLRRDVVILRVEDDYGTLFRVVADADYGNIIRIRRISETSNYRPIPVNPLFYDDGYFNYRPGFDRPIRRNKPRYDRAHAKRKAAKTAKSRAIAKRKAAKTAKPRTVSKRKRVKRAGLSPAQRKARKTARVNSSVNRKAAKSNAAKNRKTAQLRAAKNRKTAKLRADRNRRAARSAAPPVKKLPYVGLTPGRYKKKTIW